MIIALDEVPINGAAMIDLSLRDFRRALRSLEREVELALQAQTGCCGVSSAQCHLLLSIEEADRASIGDLASTLELDASTISRSVDGLVKGGLVERREDPENRRRQIVRLSEAGKAKADSINRTCDRYYRRLLDSLPPAEAHALRVSLPIFARALRAFRLSEGGEVCRETGERPS